MQPIIFKVSTTEAISSILPVASFIASEKAQLPIYGFVLFKLKDGQLFVQANTAAHTLTRTVALDGMDLQPDFAICLEAAKLRSILSGLKDGNATITFTIEGEAAVISAGRSKLKCPCLPATDYPEPPKVETAFTVNIEFSKLADLFRRTRHAIAVNDVRYYLNGLHMNFAKGSLRVVGTDGHRLSSHSLNDLSFEGEVSFIVPKKMVDLIASDKADKGTIRLRADQNMVELTWGGGQLRGRLIDGKFPETDRFFSGETALRATINRDSLIQSLARVRSVADAKTQTIRLSSDGTELKITAVENQEVAGEDWVSDAVCAKSGFPDVGVNANYLHDALSGFDDQELRLSQSVQANYLLLESASDPSKRDIVMPFRC